MKVRWSPAAADDFARIIQYIHRENPDAAERIARSIRESAGSLKLFPNRGRQGRIEGTRELPLPPLPFIVVYRVKADIVENRERNPWGSKMAVAGLNERVRGEGLPREEALALAWAASLDELLEAASKVREQGKGKTVSFSKKVFIPLTTLCRDYCSYCTFRKDPGQPGAHFMTPEEVLALAEQGRRAGCKEALFSLGDQPERIFPEAREFLRRQGYARTLDYLAAMCELVLERTGLLPHANPGVMDGAALDKLKDSNASVGLMLENVSVRLMRDGLPHANAPDKVPALRLRTMEEAGKRSIAFTTGILIGIDETMEERVDSLLAIRAMHEKYGHIQEVIVQNFRAKPDVPMAQHPEPSLEEMLRTLAIARLILGSQVNLQAPPNLSYEDFPRLLDAGINDWGGISPVTKDFINPEAGWPQIPRLRVETDARGFVLRERLALYPEFVSRQEFVSPPVREKMAALAGADGFARDESSHAQVAG